VASIQYGRFLEIKTGGNDQVSRDLILRRAGEGEERGGDDAEGGLINENGP